MYRLLFINSNYDMAEMHPNSSSGWGSNFIQAAFDLSPIAGATINMQVSESFQQIGSTVERTSGRGIYRTISGTLMNSQSVHTLQSYFYPFSKGRMTIRVDGTTNADLSADYFVSKVPTIVKKDDRRYVFSMQIFCPNPFWQTVTQTITVPGSASAGSYQISGDVEANAEITLSVSGISTGSFERFELFDNWNNKHLYISARAFEGGGSVVISHSNGMVEAVRGETSVINEISADSNFFTVIPDLGTFLARLKTSSGYSTSCTATIKYLPTFGGADI